MKHIFSGKILLFAAFLALSACSSKQGWTNDEYNIVKANNDSVTIEYDSFKTTYRAILVLAVKHCTSVGKKVKQSDIQQQASSLVFKRQTFRCVY